MKLLKSGRAFLSLPSSSQSLTLLALGFVGFVFAIITFKPGMIGLGSIPISSSQSSSSSFDCMPQVKQSSRSSNSQNVKASDPLNADIETLLQHNCTGMINTPAQNAFVDDTNDMMDNSIDKVSSPTDGRKHAHEMFSSTLTNDKLAQCDMYRGEWIEDDTYPLYKADSCPYITNKFNCQQNGRIDTKYTRWRWIPKDCNWPRFSGTAMLESLRGKRLVFVGDSLSKNQWDSMLCMLRESLIDKSRVVRRHGSNRVLKFLDYNCTVECYTTPYLVGTKEGSDSTNHIIRLDSMDKSEMKWRNADVLVFNTFHWWGPGKIGNGENRFQEGNKVHKSLDVMVAYKKALSTWGQWVDTHVDPHATRVFFRTFSPKHTR